MTKIKKINFALLAFVSMCLFVVGYNIPHSKPDPNSGLYSSKIQSDHASHYYGIDAIGYFAGKFFPHLPYKYACLCVIAAWNNRNK